MADDDMPSLNECEESVYTWLVTESHSCVYEYDFGDGWTHKVVCEKTAPREAGIHYPLCINGKQGCPPDDCGGLGGYDHVRDVLRNPKHPEHADMLSWLLIDSADQFDSSHFDPSEVHFDDPNEILEEYKKGFGV